MVHVHVYVFLYICIKSFILNLLWNDIFILLDAVLEFKIKQYSMNQNYLEKKTQIHYIILLQVGKTIKITYVLYMVCIYMKSRNSKFLTCMYQKLAYL